LRLAARETQDQSKFSHLELLLIAVKLGLITAL